MRFFFMHKFNHSGNIDYDVRLEWSLFTFKARENIYWSWLASFFFHDTAFSAYKRWYYFREKKYFLKNTGGAIMNEILYSRFMVRKTYGNRKTHLLSVISSNHKSNCYKVYEISEDCSYRNLQEKKMLYNLNKTSK